jgi:DEAD/DEAH box helicase/Helicase conserved C-terminal domain
MSRPDLQNWLVASAGFRREFSHLLKSSVARQFPALEVYDMPIQMNWPYLLMCASLLADSENGEHQDTALRIAQACISDEGTAPEEREAAAVVLDQLANRLAIDLAGTRGMIQPNLSTRLGAVGRAQWTRRSIDHSVVLSNGTTLQTNRFQRDFWYIAEANNWTSASAPTSAGKSFIILQWIADFFRVYNEAVVIYVVPTRALIHQVETDFRSLKQNGSLPAVAVSSLPVRAALRPGAGNFLVFTQERLHLFLSAFESLPAIDILVIDEAQKVGDRQRGVLLQDVIERAIAACPNTRVVFASPQTENPELLLSDAPRGVPVRAIVGNDVTVNQNLLWATETPRNLRQWKISLCMDSGVEALGTIRLSFSPTSIGKRLPFVAHAMTPADGGSLIYVDGAADAEKAADLLYDLEQTDAEEPHAAPLRELSDLAKAAVHDRYSLARVVRRRIGFHYGNMPLLLRNEIERCFKEGHLKFLVCTSTLMEGVNLPCRNIFVRGPTKGRNQPMDEPDFWNLAGRAGRWGREFQGNIVCVDALNRHVWRLGAPQTRRRFRIERTTERILQNAAELIQYIRDGTPRDQFQRRQELEYVVSYLFAKMYRTGSLDGTPQSARMSPATREALQSALSGAMENMTVAPETVWRNPGISPIAMERLKEYFRSRPSLPDDLVPVAPSSEQASSRYIAILTRINRDLAPVFGPESRIVMLGLLVTSWMRGYPLKRLITERLEYLTRKGRPAKLPAVIRSVMKDVEEVARFQAPKYLACYIDLLREHLQATGRADLLPADLDVNILLEFGVPGGTQLSLMGLGLSRTSSLALADIIASDTLSEEECVAWLHSNDWEERDLPALVKREIRIALNLIAAPPGRLSA